MSDDRSCRENVAKWSCCKMEDSAASTLRQNKHPEETRGNQCKQVQHTVVLTPDELQSPLGITVVISCCLMQQKMLTDKTSLSAVHTGQMLSSELQNAAEQARTSFSSSSLLMIAQQSVVYSENVKLLQDSSFKILTQNTHKYLHISSNFSYYLFIFEIRFLCIVLELAMQTRLALKSWRFHLSLPSGVLELKT